MLLDFIKLILHKNELLIKILKPLNQEELEIINNLHNNYELLSMNFFQYIQMYNNIAKNYDDVPTKLIETITKFIVEQNLDENNCFLIPFKNKIGIKYDTYLNDDIIQNINVNDEKILSPIKNQYFNNVFNRYQYVIKFNFPNKTIFEYRIYKVLSSELNESKNLLENIKYLEQDMIKKGTLKKHQANIFVNKLFCYGEIIN